MDVGQIPDVITRHPPASPESIERLRAGLEVELPAEYVELLLQADGVYADSFTLYQSADVPERNATYEVAVYLPGYVAIGDDGGGRGILLRGGSGGSPVFLVGHGALSEERLVQVARSLPEWIRLGCPLGDDDDS